MSNTKLKKCTIILFISLILFSAINPVFGAINDAYNKNTPVSDDDTEQKIKDSVIMDALASFVNGLASLVESLVGTAFKSLTGMNTFPWADRILFNAIPLLDINIFNPSEASLFKSKDDSEYTMLANVVRNTYFTIMTIAIAFLVVVVGIAATKLALTSLASEKAKYKEAITKWMLSIVLLFLMHNLISFIFWVNEKMVEVASSLILKQLDDANFSILNEAREENAQKFIDNFYSANKGNVWNDIMGGGVTQEEKDILYEEDSKIIVYKLITNGNYIDSVLFDAHGDASHVKRNNFSDIFTGNGPDSIKALARDVELIKNGSISGTAKLTQEGKKLAANFKNQDIFNLNYNAFKNLDLEGWFNVGLNYNISIEDYKRDIGRTFEDVLNDSNTKYSYYRLAQIGATYTSTNEKKAFNYYQKYIRAMTNVYYEIHPEQNPNGDNITDKKPDLMANLGEYFKESAYVIPTDDETGEVTGWHRSKLTVQGALLYAIFVFQSMFYFFAYIKRFFYIVVLVIMAPAIVVMDFLRKALV